MAKETTKVIAYQRASRWREVIGGMVNRATLNGNSDGNDGKYERYGSYAIHHGVAALETVSQSTSDFRISYFKDQHILDRQRMQVIESSRDRNTHERECEDEQDNGEGDIHSEPDQVIDNFKRIDFAQDDIRYN